MNITTKEQAPCGRRVNNMNKIGIIGAMEMEVETLKAQMEVTSTTVKANMTFVEGKLGKADVVVV